MIKVIKVSASWCGPCKALAPIWKKVKENSVDTEFEEIDADTGIEKCRELGVKSVPTLIFCNAEGKEVSRHTGMITESALREKIAETKGL